MKFFLLRLLLTLDAFVLFLLGAWLILAPSQVEKAFHFQNLPPAVSYLIGLWGCVLATMGFGYFIAATNPIRHRVWIQVAIARGALEFVLGGIYLARGVVTLQQAGLGLVVTALIPIAYIALYPRPPRLVKPTETPASPPASP